MTKSDDDKSTAWKLAALTGWALFIVTIFIPAKAPRVPAPVCPSASASVSAAPPVPPLDPEKPFVWRAGWASPEPSGMVPMPVSSADAAQLSSRDLVTAVVGRWKGSAGELVEIDPVRTRSGSKPPYHVIITLSKEKAFGCDFAGVPSSGVENTYRAWCGGAGKGRDSSRLALSYDPPGTLTFSLLVDGAWVVKPGFFVRLDRPLGGLPTQDVKK